MAKKADAAPADPPKPKAAPKRTEYVVFHLPPGNGGKLEVVNVRRREVSPKYPEGVATIAARTPEEAREIAFEFLTKEQPAEKRDDFTAELVALAARGWSFELMAWSIKREMKRG